MGYPGNRTLRYPRAKNCIGDIEIESTSYRPYRDNKEMEDIYKDNSNFCDIIGGMKIGRKPQVAPYPGGAKRYIPNTRDKK